MVGDDLYRRGFSQPLLRCISKSEAEQVMAETHEGVCGNHIGGRALSAKILRTGYYWPTMKKDCIAKVKACDNCQKHATISTTPAEKLHTLESAIEETPFKLVYGAEALIPIEIGLPTLRAELYEQDKNNKARRTDLDLIDEERDMATIRQRATKQFLEKRHNKRVILRTIKRGELVLRKTEDARRPQAHVKLAANWEGPFRVNSVLRKRAYQLETLSGDQISGN
ncbi:uncharacterized protein [Arachis hypogaea]|uniref:uncharacterized protein n=1 Tax=Arachis hypogaea TaxID=3818 RepID=UPI003B21039B